MCLRHKKVCGRVYLRTFVLIMSVTGWERNVSGFQLNSFVSQVKCIKMDLTFSRGARGGYRCSITQQAERGIVGCVCVSGLRNSGSSRTMLGRSFVMACWMNTPRGSDQWKSNFSGVWSFWQSVWSDKYIIRIHFWEKWLISRSNNTGTSDDRKRECCKNIPCMHATEDCRLTNSCQNVINNTGQRRTLCACVLTHNWLTSHHVSNQHARIIPHTYASIECQTSTVSNTRFIFRAYEKTHKITTK